MKIKYVLLCNNVEVCPNGTHNILGVYDTINSPRYPVKLEFIRLFSKVLFDLNEIGQHSISINIIDEDGKEIFKSPVFNMEIVLENLLAEINLCLKGVVFLKSGTYELNIFFDKKIVFSQQINALVSSSDKLV